METFIREVQDEVPLTKSNSKGDILQCIISLCQKEIVTYNDFPMEHGRVEMAREIIEIVNTKNKKV